MNVSVFRRVRSLALLAILLSLFVLPGCDEEPTSAASTESAAVADSEAVANRAESDRFAGIGEWAGVFETGSEGSGTTPVAGNGTTEWKSSVRVNGHFKLAPHNDPRNGPEITWRGKGEAHVVASARKVTQYPDQKVIETWVGDYVDTINVEVSNIDLENRTYQLSIIRDLWQEQPHKGECIETTTVTITRYGTYVDTRIGPGHSWADDGGAGFGRESPLPEEGYVINGSMMNKNTAWLDPTGEEGVNHGWTTSWQIRPIGPQFDEPLEARPGGPYVAERGRLVNLDGFRSTGKIISWHWKFEPADGTGDVPFNSGATKEGRHVPVVVLAPVKATLTVSDGVKEDSESVVIGVTPRDYATPFHHRAGEAMHPNSPQPRLIEGHDVRFVGGENVCALCDYQAKDSVHIFHPPAKAKTWRDVGYKLTQVKDANGPFDGVWYVTDYAMQIERQTLLNKYIVKGGPPPISHGKKFYETNLELGNPIDKYIEAVKAHELLHSEMAKAALPANDPGPKLEPMASKDEAALKQKADELIQAAENAVDAASSDDLPLPSVGFEGTISFPNDSTDVYVPMQVAF